MTPHNPTPAVPDVVPTMPDNKAAEANAQLAAIRAKPHNGKTYQADDVDYLLALAETQGRGLGAINPQWFRDQAKLVKGTLDENAALHAENARLKANLQFTDEANEAIGKQNDQLKRQLSEARNVIEPKLRDELARYRSIVGNVVHDLAGSSRRAGKLTWVRVKSFLCLKSPDDAKAICREFGVDPDTGEEIL